MKQAQAVLAFLVAGVASIAGAQGACPAKAAAWNVSQPGDIPDLEAKGFNLFFVEIATGPGPAGDLAMLAPAEQDSRIQSFISRLGPCSQLILGLRPWLSRNWSHGGADATVCPGVPTGTTGMEAFVRRWGGSQGSQPKVYGFLLSDDVTLTPLGEGCGTPSNALWVVRWFYRMIRNSADGQSNSYGTDLAPGKKVIVTMPFDPRSYNAQFQAHFNMQPSFLVPPGFFQPGDAWDVMAMYFYPHTNYLPQDGSLGNTLQALYSEMARMFPATSRMPLLQAASWESAPPGDKLLFQPDLRIQYQKMMSAGLLEGSAGLGYFTANWHLESKDLLHITGTRIANDTNPYYRSAGIINAFHQNVPIGPR
ncbi:hypothetical protein [Corallococcus llansteffanensis]|uniref:Uncharacterized protein n=1 Tax=Corallococcus llansteffanensis TaxID=2316731 RepID=A0A3A8QRM2_9BACT|nr:hypothetical protein [Corallococcus llansteffanensis]RKH69035.1 hypothetical protein D7V93_00515 [Corallococcus llansteffanensis]